MFRQTMSDGFQREAPDYWLNFGNPWEIMRPNVSYTVKFYGHVSVHEVCSPDACRRTRRKFTYEHDCICIHHQHAHASYDSQLCLIV